MQMRRSEWNRALSTMIASLGTSVLAQAQFTLSEVYPNVPGTDQGQEAVEIIGTASTVLTGWYFLAIDGDGTSAGVVDQAVALGGYSTGSNGILLIRDASSTILPAPDPATSVVVFDFNPDIENGSNTYALGFGTAPAVGADLDTNDDGTLNAGALAGFTVADVVSLLENDGASNFAYADDLGGTVIGPFNGPVPDAHTPDALYRIYDASGPCSWAGGDVTGTNPGGPYTYALESGEAFGFQEHGITEASTLNLGSANIVP